MLSYEEQRQQNIRENEELLKSLGLNEARAALPRAAPKPARKKAPTAKQQREKDDADYGEGEAPRRSGRARRPVDRTRDWAAGTPRVRAHSEDSDGEYVPAGHPQRRRYADEPQRAAQRLGERIHDPKTYGAIPGVAVGTWWATRMECSTAAVHAPTVAGISGNAGAGAWSVALSGGYPDDVDLGDAFTYTGSGGRDLKGTRNNPKNLRTAPQTSDQSFDNPKNAALKKSAETGKPVRVVRGYKLDSQYAPPEGYRYDGLYVVEKAWMAKGLTKGLLVCRYAFKRLAGQPPLPVKEDDSDDEEEAEEGEEDAPSRPVRKARAKRKRQESEETDDDEDESEDDDDEEDSDEESEEDGEASGGESEGEETEEPVAQPTEQPVKRGPGRPRKNPLAAAPAEVEKSKRGPGRPKKARRGPERPRKEPVAAESEAQPEQPPKRRPGRPKKNPLPAPAEPEEEPEVEEPEAEAPKRGRGRPRGSGTRKPGRPKGWKPASAPARRTSGRISAQAAETNSEEDAEEALEVDAVIDAEPRRSARRVSGGPAVQTEPRRASRRASGKQPEVAAEEQPRRPARRVSAPEATTRARRSSGAAATPADSPRTARTRRLSALSTASADKRRRVMEVVIPTPSPVKSVF